MIIMIIFYSEVIMPGDEKSYSPYISGSAVPEFPNSIKMIVALYATTSKEFVRHNGGSDNEKYIYGWMDEQR